VDKSGRQPKWKRKEKECEAIPLRPEKRGGTEDKDTKNGKTGKEKEDFEKFAAGGGMARISEDEDQKWGQGENAKGVPDPPGEPGGAEIVPIGKAGGAEKRHADGGTDGSGRNNGETDEAEDVFASVKDMNAASELIHKVGSRECFEGVAESNAGRDRNGDSHVVIDEESSEKDGRRRTAAMAIPEGAQRTAG
jgi:hypothetical protein